MNACRNCRKPIPARLCFCSACMPKLTQNERVWLLTAQSAADRERLARIMVVRLNGGTPPPRRDSIPPTDAAAAFREARRILAPLLGKKV